LPFFSPGRAKKRHSFHDWRIGRREALSTPEARKGRGSEHGGFYAARSCTSGVDRRSRTEPRVRREMNVEPVVQPKAAPLGLSGWGVTGRERPRMDGKRRTPASPAVAAGEGRSILPAKESIRLFIAELGRVHIEMRSDWRRLVPCLAGSCSGSSTTRGSETGEAI
jgi:hypothetical protein